MTTTGYRSSLPRRRIGREWRCVVADAAEVVAACEYGTDRRHRAGSVPSALLEHASQVARHAWQPAPLYCVDIVEVDGGLGVLELDPFSGADLYGCDPDAIVDAASRIAQRPQAEPQ